MTEQLVRHYHQISRLSKARRPNGRGIAAFPGALLFNRVMPMLVIGASLAGCAVSMPIATLSGSNDDVTGSIETSSLEGKLDAEDWRRAKAALSTALDPQGNGTEVGWDNAQSGVSGAFSPIGKPYPSDARICRAFRAGIQRKSGAETMDGVACADKSGDWSISNIGPAKKT